MATADGTTNTHCLNCGAELSGPFCSACGQRDTPAVRPLVEWIREWAAEVSSLDFKLASTLRELLCRPGRLTRDVLDGKRASSTPPLRLYVVVSAVSIALMNLVGAFEIAQQAGPRLAEVAEALGVPQLVEPDFQRRVNRRMNTLFPILNLMTPLALALALQVSSLRRYFQEHLVFGLHFGTAIVAMGVVILPVFRGGETVRFVVSVALGLAILVHLWKSLAVVYPASRAGAVARFVWVFLVVVSVAQVIALLTLRIAVATA